MLDFLTHKSGLSAGRFGQFSLTKQLGAPIDFVWPCTNSGDADGAAFIKVTEAGLTLWDGPPFTIPKGQTVSTTLHQTITQSLGLHNLIADLREGLPPLGVGALMSDTVALTVVSNPILAAVGPPTINGLVGPPAITVVKSAIVPVSWDCQNSGGGDGLSRLRVKTFTTIAFGPLVTIPGFTTTKLLISFGPGDFGATSCVLTMEDSAGVILASWPFTWNKTNV